jgi:signal transduction histidine kinase
MALQTKLVLFFSTLVLLFTLQWALFVGHERRLLMEEMEERAGVLARTLSELAREPLIGLQIARIDQQIHSIQQERDVVWARVADRHFRILSDTRKEEEGWIHTGSLPRNLEIEIRGHLLFARSPIIVAGVPAGMAEIAFSLEPLQEKIARNRNIFIGILSFQIVVSVLIFLLLNVQILQPLKIVIQQVINLPPETEKGSLEAPRHSSPEIVRMVEAVQRMRDRLLAFQREAVTEARFAVMGKLTSHMAHEIRNPLEAISGAVELIQSDIPDPAPAQKYLAVIWEEIGILNNYVREILDLTKPEVPQPVPTPLLPLAEETVLLVAPVARKRNITLSIEEGQTPPLCRVDRSQLKRALLNLVLNGIEACSAGGVVKIKVEGKDGDGWIRVQDSGCGIPREIRNKVFDPYFTTKREGTGLGLSISKRIIERNGGSLGIESEERKGTEVWIRLPGMEAGSGTNPVGG